MAVGKVGVEVGERCLLPLREGRRRGGEEQRQKQKKQTKRFEVYEGRWGEAWNDAEKEVT